MDLELQFNDITCFAPIGTLSASHEETLETVIPEYCPDITRIIDTVGQLCIREKLCGKDCYTVSGAVKVTVLYTSEEAAGVRTLHVSVPFTCRWEDGRLLQCQAVDACGRVLLAEARAITSRKLYLRVLPEITLQPYTQVQRHLCCGAQEERSLRLLEKEKTVSCLCAASEKQFNFTQDAPLPEGEHPEDLLLVRLCPGVSSLQRVGNKFSLKGEMAVYALYCDEARALRTYQGTLPIAEVLEAGELPEEAEYAVTLQLCEYDGRLLRADTGSAIGITAAVNVRICAYCRSTVKYLEDLYSVRCRADTGYQQVEIPQCAPPRQIAREFAERLEFGTAEPFVFVTQWDLAPVAVMQEEGGTYLRTTLHLRLLYLDENGAPASAERTAEVSVSTGEATGNVMAACTPPAARWTGNVCELRGQVVFTVGCSSRETLQAVSCVTLSQEEKRAAGPGLILRRMRPGETLWDIAKQYRADSAAIEAANPQGIDGEKLLLIPRAR